MSWNDLPPELHLAIVHLLPPHAVHALASTASAPRALCLPTIFAHVSLPSVASLHAFARHVPPAYGQYVRSLAVCTKHHPRATGAPPTDLILAVLRSCTRLTTLSLSIASSLDAEKLVSAFSRLSHVHTFDISCWGREDVAPVSERLVVALAASLPSLAHLTLSRITRSAIHVDDPCDVPFDVPIVTNDFDVPPHPLLGSDLALPNLLRLPTLRTLEIRDTWMGCDTHIDLDPPATSTLERLVLTGSMYTADTQCEAQACAAWIYACPSLRSVELGTALGSLPRPPPPSQHARVSHVHLDASRILVDDLPPTLDAIKSCGVESITIGYEPERHTAFDDLALKSPPQDDFARECALDDLEDWRTAIDAFLLGRSREEWSGLLRVGVSLADNIHASWDL